jgi:dienelactone hydrolase
MSGAIPLPVRLYSRFSHYDVAVSDQAIPGPHGSIDVLMYTPRQRPDAPIIVFIHGMAPDGNRNELLSSISYRMARIGLRVATPTIPELTHRLMRASSIPEIDAVVHWVAGVSKMQVSLFGISFSGGLAIAAASQPEIAPDVKLVFSLTGYNDITRLGHYYIGDGEAGPNGDSEQTVPGGWGTLLIAGQYMDEMVPAANLPAIQAALDGQPGAAEKLTAEQRTYLRDLQTVASPEMHRRYIELLDRHREEMDAVSPHEQMHGLRAKLYILHPSVDVSIPKEEAEWDVRDAPSSVEVHALITPYMQHATLGPKAPLREKIRIGIFLGHLLDDVSRSSRLPSTGPTRTP